MRAAVLLALLSVSCQFVFGRPLKGGQVRGTLSYQQAGSGESAPAAGARVRLVGTTLGALADADGRFVFTSVPVGRHTLRAEFTPPGASKVELLVPGLEIKTRPTGTGASERNGVDLGALVMGALGEITGTVLKDGAAVTGAKVVANGFASVPTGAGGAYTLKLPAGDFELVAVYPDAPSTRVTQKQALKVRAAATVNFAATTADPDAGSLSGEALYAEEGDADHSGIYVRLVPAAGGAEIEVGETTANGLYAAADVPAGLYTLRASATGFRDAYIGPIAVFPGASAPEVVLSPAPQDPAADCDRDGTADSADDDDDDDGVLDAHEAAPCVCDPSGSTDANSNSICDGAEGLATDGAQSCAQLCETPDPGNNVESSPSPFAPGTPVENQSVCDSTDPDDFYKFTLQDGEQALLTVDPLCLSGNALFYLQVYRGLPSLNNYVDSFSASQGYPLHTEQLRVPLVDGGAPQDFFVHVREDVESALDGGPADSGFGFRMDLQVADGGTCFDDEKEPDDSAAAAKPVSFATSNPQFAYQANGHGYLCGGEDWESMELLATTRLWAQVYVPSGSPPVLAKLVGPPNGTTILDQQTAVDQSGTKILGTAAQAGTHFMVFSPADTAPTSYSYYLSKYAPDNCVNDADDPGDSSTQPNVLATTGTFLSEYGRHLCGTSDQDWYQIRVPANGSAFVSVNAEPYLGTVDFAVFETTGAAVTGITPQPFTGGYSFGLPAQTTDHDYLVKFTLGTGSGPWLDYSFYVSR